MSRTAKQDQLTITQGNDALPSLRTTLFHALHTVDDVTEEQIRRLKFGFGVNISKPHEKNENNVQERER